MAKSKSRPIDGNEAAAEIAHLTNEVIAIYPITPASPMGEWADEWSSRQQPNLWGSVPRIIEMQSEAGAAGTIHGALQAGSLATTFTASQGLLLMIPNMFKIAGELTPTVFHVAARSVACQALSIFGDHSDVMAARTTGYAFMASNSPQEVLDLSLIAQAATLESRLPIVHFFDGFRTSHEVAKINSIDIDVVRQLISEEHVKAHRQRAMSPAHPVIRGTSQNPDVYFQARETANPYYEAMPGIVQKIKDQFGAVRVQKLDIPSHLKVLPDVVGDRAANMALQEGIVLNPALGMGIEIECLGCLLAIAAALPWKHCALKSGCLCCRSCFGQTPVPVHEQ